jgi:glutathione S-transferase
MFIPNAANVADTLARPDCYVVYGWQRSYFTHKLMAALHLYGANWEFRPKTKDNEHEIRVRAGTHQIPVLHTPENWMIADTTPLLHMLDARFPERSMFPVGPLGILTQIVEEFFDEWVARTTVHWRWNYRENHALLSLDGAHGDAEIAAALVVWGGKVCRATGVSSTIQQQAAEDEYHRIMQAADAQLKRTRYLLGDRPTAVDCIVLAGLRAHFLFDPAPNRALRARYPDVVQWVESGADSWDGKGELAPFPESTAFARSILSEMTETWAPFACGNRKALADGQRAFVANIYGEDVSYLARPYIEQSRQMIVSRIPAQRYGGEPHSFQRWLSENRLDHALS